VLRVALVLQGLVIALTRAILLHDGDSRLGVPVRSIQVESPVAGIDTWPELLVTGAIAGIFASLFILAGVSPRHHSRTTIAPLLVSLACVPLVAVPFVTSSGQCLLRAGRRCCCATGAGSSPSPTSFRCR
jgi:hypothetical protein